MSTWVRKLVLSLGWQLPTAVVLGSALVGAGGCDTLVPAGTVCLQRSRHIAGGEAGSLTAAETASVRAGEDTHSAPSIAAPFTTSPMASP